jgi:hypothetical protein
MAARFRPTVQKLDDKTDCTSVATVFKVPEESWVRCISGGPESAHAAGGKISGAHPRSIHCAFLTSNICTNS